MIMQGIIDAVGIVARQSKKLNTAVAGVRSSLASWWNMTEEYASARFWRTTWALVRITSWKFR
jgi:hypothetical protein